MNVFVGRKKELKELNKRYESGKKEFGVIYGRRRIGKSYLIEHFIKEKEGLFFQAKNDNTYGNLKSFSYELNSILGLPSSFVFSSWQEALSELSKHIGNRRFVLVIDEYPYIVQQDKSFPSILQEFIDHSKNNIMLIISGSDISMLKKEINNHNSPLYKRRTFEMSIEKLPYMESLEFLKKYKNEDKAKFISLFSTYPYYLSAIDDNLSFEDNIKNLLFNQYGTFFTLPDQILSNSTNRQDVYNSILSAISSRHRTNKDISLYIHEPEAKVNKYLKILTNSEIVEKRETFMGNQKSNYYEISDQLLKFWYSFIFPNIEKIKINSNIVYKNEKNNIDIFLDHGFEHICSLYIEKLNEEGKLEDVFDRPKIYKVEKSKLNRSIEIDGLSKTKDKLLVIDCKNRKNKYDLKMFEHLKESVSVFPDKLNRIYYIFSKGGFDKDILNIKDSSLHLIEYNNLFNITKK